MRTIERPLSPSPYCAQFPEAEELQVRIAQPCSPVLQCTILWKVLVVAATARVQLTPAAAPKLQWGVNCAACAAPVLVDLARAPLELFRHIPGNLGLNFDDAAERARTHSHVRHSFTNTAATEQPTTPTMRGQLPLVRAVRPLGRVRPSWICLQCRAIQLSASPATESPRTGGDAFGAAVEARDPAGNGGLLRRKKRPVC